MQARTGRTIDQELIGLSGGLFQDSGWDDNPTVRRESIAARAEGARNKALWIMGFAVMLAAIFTLIALLFIAPPQRAAHTATKSSGATVLFAVLTTALRAAREVDARSVTGMRGEATSGLEAATAVSDRPAQALSARGSSKRASLSKGSARRRRGASRAQESPGVAAAQSPEMQGPEAQSPEAQQERAINQDAVATAIAVASGLASSCIDPLDPRRSMRVNVTFMPTGRVTTATVNGGPYAGTEAGGCIARALRSAVVEPFDGTPVTVSTHIRIR